MDNFLNTFISNINLSDINMTEESLVTLWNDADIRNRIISNSSRIDLNSIILVKDQEDLIKKSIASAERVSDNVYVCDTGSQDNTIEVVKKLQSTNKNIILRTLVWEDDFGKMRNKALKETQSHWAFFIDSDEEILTDIDKTTLKLILSVIDFCCTDCDICLCFKQIAEDSIVVNWAERLIRKTNTVSFFGYVHEEPRAKNLKRIKSQFTIYNNGRSDEQMEKFNKEEKYYRLLEKNIGLEPTYIKWYALLPFNYGINNDANYCKKLENVYYKIDKMVNYNDDTFFEESLIINYIRCLISNNEIKKALKVLYINKDKYPLNTSILYFYYLLKNIEIMENAREQLISLKQDISYLEREDSNLTWKQYQSIDILGDVMAKFLFKCEEYELAKPLIKDCPADALGRSLLEKEFKLLKKE